MGRTVSLTYPHAVAVDAAGALYAAETGDRWVETGPFSGSAFSPDMLAEKAAEFQRGRSCRGRPCIRPKTIRSGNRPVFPKRPQS